MAYPNARPRAEPKFAKLRLERAHHHPGIDPRIWWEVARVEELGVIVASGRKQLFMYWSEVETRE